MWGANNANDCMQLHNTKKWKYYDRWGKYKRV